MNKTNKTRKSLKLLALIVYASFAVSIFSTLSFGYVGSIYSFGPIQGYSYFNANLANISGNKLYCETLIGCTTNVPARYMGTQVKVYSNSGSLLATGDWCYNANTVTVGSGYSGQYLTTTVRGTYQVQGSTRCYTTDPNALYVVSFSGGIVHRYYQHATNRLYNVTL